MGKPTNHRPERPEQHEIDEAAQRVFIQALPLGWVHRKQDPDYRVDYLVEVGKEGNLTGLTVGVQLKGKRAFKTRGGHVSFSIETKHLDYYLKRREPIFLVLADVTAGKAYWLFTQQYALESLAGKDWHNQKSVVVRAPVVNLLTDLAKFEAAAREADRYMAGVRPAATQAALRAERQKLEALDPRFRVAVSATEKACNYTLHAKEDVTVGLTFKGDPNKVSKLVQDLVDRGLPVQFDPGDAEISGSALLAKALASGGTLHAMRGFDATLRLSAPGDSERERPAIELPARFEGGLSAFRGSAEISTAPLIINLVLRFAEGVPARTLEFSLAFALERWARRSILHLPYFDQTHSILRAVLRGAELQLDAIYEGSRMFGCQIEASMVKHLEESARIVDTYAKARQLARVLGINPEVPADMTYDELSEIEALHLLFMPGQKEGEGVEMTMRIEKSEIRKILDAPECLMDCPLKFRSKGESVCLLRQSVWAGPSECELTHARLAIRIDELRQLAGADGEGIGVPFVGTANSRLFIRRG